ncbi:CNNM domain-containing protein [Ferrovum sp. PN-J185]|uniref:HlyC/CorC family transporter n=1 Tax=Ferrovum sp. PN-J185 TaxID=1356306 RepID=UPI001E2FA2D4|nr:CNNM domain-containing protein [Ferrovum sp. PN-J185]MCC6068846.1 CNNM domain-containing protein [Ferrovum sp. PN-J185]
MDDIPIGVLLSVLAVLLVLSGFFSMAETSMMALNRFRLKHWVAQGHRGAKLTQELLEHTDRLLGVLLLGNNFINAASAAIVTVLTVRLLGKGEVALTIGTILVTLAILIFSEITPKILGAAYAEKIAFHVSYVLVPLLRVCYPIVWFVNLFVQGLLNITRLKPKTSSLHTSMTLEELRVMVLEGSRFIPQKHHHILMNLFNLTDITVKDVMIPRNQIEGIDLSSPLDLIEQQLSTSNHTLQLIYDGDPDQVLGVLHVRKLFNQIHNESITVEAIKEIIESPYFVPENTPLFTQLNNFQENRRKMGLVVDEYGELQGLVSVEDILEEIVGEFSSQLPYQGSFFTKEEEGVYLVDGACSLRDLNRKLNTHFHLDGPRTLNGLIIETLEDIPEPGTALKLDGYPVEIIQTQDRMVKMVRLQTLQFVTKQSEDAKS